MFYKLDENHQIVSLGDDVIAWGRNLDEKRRIALDRFEDGVWVSTVFLGIEHTGGMFETMIFGSEREYQERCETYEEALEMHQRACNFVRANREHESNGNQSEVNKSNQE